MVVYRINDCKYIRDLSGKGAATYGGRWNSKDTYMVYTAQSRALSLLEAVVHIGRIPEASYCMATIDIPADSIQTFPLEKLPEGWYNHPAPDYIKNIGDNFIRANKFLALEIPSALMMEEHNYLLNPAHPHFRKVKIISQRSIKMDERLFQPGN
jgi:RES domain-containing protein